jgi:hypothetical protein
VKLAAFISRPGSPELWDIPPGGMAPTVATQILKVVR